MGTNNRGNGVVNRRGKGNVCNRGPNVGSKSTTGKRVTKRGQPCVAGTTGLNQNRKGVAVKCKR